MTKRQSRRSESEEINRTPILTPLAAAMLTAIYPVGAAMAQDAGADDEALEEVVVTGSRIKKDTFSSAAPMDTITTSSANVRGITDVSTLLQTTTVAMGSPQVTAASSGVFVENGGLGTATVSVRGLGANRTLVLLNGRRAGPSGVKGSVSSFDLNILPLAAIERVEILKDGASSIYGSDAVAGVVNIITKKTDGATFDAFISQPEQTGGEQYRLTGSWGKTFDRGYFRATADYNKTKILKRGDRDFFDCDEDYVFEPGTNLEKRADLIDPRSGQFFCDGTTWGHVWVYDYAENVTQSGVDAGDGTTNAGRPVFLLQYDFNQGLSSNGVPPLAPQTNPNDMSVPQGWYPVSRGDTLTNSVEDSDHPFHDSTTLGPENETVTLFLEAEYNISDNVTAYGELLVNRRETRDEGFTQVWTYVYNYDSADWLGFGNCPVNDPTDLEVCDPADNVGGRAGVDPFSAGWTGAQWYSPLAIADDYNSSVTVDYTRFVAGLRGDLDSSWSWDLSFQYSQSDGEYIDDVVLQDALELPFFRTGSCVGETTSISNRPCVDMQWLDPDFLNGNWPTAYRDYIFDVDTGNTEYTQWSLEGFMTGDMFEMPAGTAAGAFGFHYRDDELLDTPGPIVLANNAWQADAAGITAGNDSTIAVFGEIDLPLLADMPGVEYLNFNASVRYTDVDSFGDDTTYKVGLDWAITESFRARSTFGTSFRTPALYELYLADQTSGISARVADPCIAWGSNLALGNISQRTADNCAADNIPVDHIATVGPTVVTGGGAGVLTAETSEAFTFGVVWQPAFAELSVSIDYFDILVEDEVDVIGGREIVHGCYESPFGLADPLCSLFDREPPSAALPNSITLIRDSFINVSKQEIRGMDIAATWYTELGNFGGLTVDTQWTLNFEDTIALFDETEEDVSGEAGHPETVGTFSLTWDKNAWSVFWGMQYIGETDNFASFGRNTVSYVFGSDSASGGTIVEIDLIAEATIYHNLSASYNFDNGLVLRGGVANVLDELPPRMTNQGTGSEVDVLGAVAFYSQYDWLARRYFLQLSMDFE
ncbi:MAG: iron complex outermembrane receptor protein [Woeseiaceae bacterium]|jgi:iron complex outermembrane receptor protein